MKANRRRIAIVGMNYAPEITGCGRYTGDLAQKMVERGHDVSVITTPPHYPGWSIKNGYRNRYSREVLDGVRVHRCPVLLRKAMGGIWRLIAPVSFALTAAPVTLWRIVRDRPDVVLVIEPTLFAAPMALLAAALVRARTVLHVQDLEVDAAFAVGHLKERKSMMRIAAAFERFCLGRFGQIVTISRQMAEKIVEKKVDRTRISVIRNWVDVDHIRPIANSTAYRAELGVPADSFVVLYSGNLGPKQGLDMVVEAARLLKDDHRHIHFAITGEGPSKPDLERRAADLPNVTFLPFQPYERLGEFLGIADIHILPQQASTGDLVLPSKLGGMLASGRPIVVTAEKQAELAIFLEGCVTVVEPGDPGEIAEALAVLAVQDEDSAAFRRRLDLARQLSHRTAFDRFEQVLLGEPLELAGNEIARRGDSGSV